MKPIPFLDLQKQHAALRRELHDAVARVLRRGDFILGEEVSSFEREFAHFCGCRYALGVSSGTAALFLSLVALDIKEGDEVIVPNFTFIATAMAVTYTGARPVFCDIDESTYNLDVGQVERLVTRRTKAIIPVHLFGRPAQMKPLLAIARTHGLKVIEDAAQAHGAQVSFDGVSWRQVGSLGDAGCFSFYPSKNLGGCGDGGMIVTNDRTLYERLRILRDCGRVSKYEHAVIGYNSRLDTLQAAFLRVKLPSLVRWNRLRCSVAQRYDELLEGIPGVMTPCTQERSRPVYHVYAVRVNHRDQVQEALKRAQIATMVHYPLPLHLQKAYAGLGYKRGDFPVSEIISQQILSLPMHPFLPEAQVKRVSSVLKHACQAVMNP